MIPKNAGGIGIATHKVRATGSYIAGTNGTSNGIVPMLRVFNNTARYVDQGGGKRKGSFAMYLEPWHSDLFMERVKNDTTWSLMCPNECPGLQDAIGDKF